MKKRLSLFFVFSFLFLIPGKGHALLNDSKIEGIIRLSGTACAIEVKVLDPVVDLVDIDSVHINGSLLATLAAALQLNLNLGDVLLIASPSFEALAHVDADAHFDDSNCLKLNAGATVDLVSDGLTVIQSITLPAGFGDLIALELNNLNLFDLIDLDNGTAEVTNSQEDISTVGGGSGGSTGGSSGTGTQGGNTGVGSQGTGGTNSASGPEAAEGCSMNPRALGNSSSRALLILLLPLVALRLSRKGI